MEDVNHGSQFAQRLQALAPVPSDRTLRRLVFVYCRLYQDVYSFDQLDDAFAYLAIELQSEKKQLEAFNTEVPVIPDAVLGAVQQAMGEYFESLNEVATAIHRLLDPRELTISDTLAAINHVWLAHACNESPSEFAAREDGILFELLTRLVPT